MLETFLEVEFEELSDDIKDKVEEGVKKRLNAINMFLENPKRIELIAKDIAEHFKENVDGTFKAMVVAASRKSCAYYKEALDKWLPKVYSEVVMTYNERSDSQIIQHRISEAKAQYGEKEMDEIRKEFKRAFELYSEEEIKGALSGMESLREDFNILLNGLLALFYDIPKDSYDRQTMLRAIEVLTTDEENSKRFLEDYGELRKIFEHLHILYEYCFAEPAWA